MSRKTALERSPATEASNMTTNNQWDGLPDNPHVDGWHWLKHPEDLRPFPSLWNAELSGWPSGSVHSSQDIVDLGFVYLGPCLTPNMRLELEQERDALLAEWREIAAGLTNDEPEIGALWPMVAEVSGSLSAVQQYFKNEVAAHNVTKAERDAAIAGLTWAKWGVQLTHAACADSTRPRQHVVEMLANLLADPMFATLTSALEAPKNDE